MVDRKTIYFGQEPLETDLLGAQQYGMVGLAYLSQSVFGTNTLVDGFTCTPTTPTASLNVVLSAGNIYQLENLEQTTWSSLAADTVHTIMKQGILLDPVTLAITPPGTTGFSQVYMIEVQYQDQDTGSVTLPYFDAANPSLPFSGPGNDGLAQNTIRKGLAAYQVKAGIAAATGTQVAPTPDAGWSGLFLITVANGQSSITSGNIATYSGAPFLPTLGHLPQIPTGVQNGTWIYAADTSAGGAPAQANGITTTSSSVLNFASVPAYVSTGMTVFNLTNPGSINAGQTISSKTGTTVTLNSNVNGQVNIGDVIGFSTNAFAATISSPNITTLTTGMGIRLKAAGPNTGPATFNLNGLGAVAIHRANGQALLGGDISANEITELRYDGGAWQIANFYGLNPAAPISYTFYVNGGTGNDANNGLTSGTAFATTQKAMNVAGQYPPGPIPITINIADWSGHTYAGCSTPTYPIPPIILNGTSQANTVIDGLSGTGVLCQGGNNVTIQNMTVQATTGTWTDENPLVSPNGILAYGGVINIGANCAFGPAVGQNIMAAAYGTVNVRNNLTISGAGGQAVFSLEDSGLINFFTVVCTISVAISVVYFVRCDDVSVLQLLVSGGLTFTNPSNVTGQRYISSDLSMVETDAGGANFFPGTIAGSTLNGGQYT